MKRLLTIALGAGLLIGIFAPAYGAEQPLTVVELYTSQGCSSCPPADAYLGKLAVRDDVLALSFHVDYWDYIGWKDPFADPRYTARQRAFSVIFSQRYVYTPQMVVHGAYQVVGSQPSDIEGAITRAKKMLNLPVALKAVDGGFQVDLAAAPAQKGVTVIAVFFDDMHATDIRHGENAGEKLINYNVVRDFQEIGLWNGEARSISFKNVRSKGENCAILLQSAQTGQIVGAAKLAHIVN
ncbi:MAG: DUF1223 domain-containing protein [Rhodospirillales bacterium]|nr:DUF1223 domain-containing protein [Rhodospirillales bacterium]